MNGLLKHWAPSAKKVCCTRAPNSLRRVHDGLAAMNPKEKLEKFTLLERQILRPDRAETCQTGTDDEVARHKSPYDPTQTTVDKEVTALREEYRLEGDLHDPLLVSPANQQSSHIFLSDEERAVYGVPPLGSVKGWTSKRKKVLLRTEPYAFRAYEIVFPVYMTDRKVVMSSNLVRFSFCDTS
ncbi:uncharacterized protein N7482_004789 [Penicillium canariense]|uniref:Uncharacterized protein n=1 Tax=Penicillium canariense TaxID=189055 RepID=A0A9W9LQN5_9EURO|nr:uncharacterized protein N7482_004789 [Penicillium canariense]KAJ5169195.1 hypothetical protein N7482_004789 [Penicillium canariense]